MIKNNLDKKKIINLLKKKIKFEKIIITDLNFKKILVEIDQKHKKKIYKVFGKGSPVKNFYNEIIAFNNSELKKIYNILKPVSILKNSNNKIIEYKFIGRVKGSYFNFNNFINLKKYFRSNKKKISAYRYINDLKKNYKEIYKSKFKNDLDKIIDIFLIKNNLKNFTIKVSHGDFVHWNSLIYKKKNYVIDLEYFKKDRLIFFDIFHWYLFPILEKFYKFRPFLSLNFVFFVTLKFLEHMVGNISKKYNYNFIINDYLFFYLLEQIFIYENVINSNKYKDITSKKYLMKAKFIKQSLMHLIKILIKLDNK
tara:strand:+ start:1563 stop:2492 length:930 start_codon:yes stop_codon:yes gene_type:complete